MRILHLLHRSVPGTHGYAVRSEIIVMKQLGMGLEPLVVTSPSQAPAGELDADGSETIGGVRYYRTCGAWLRPTQNVQDGSPLRSALRILQNARFLQKTLHLARTLRPDVLHAHSPFTCGLIADLVGKWTGIPAVYEIRGVWEDSHVSRHGLSPRSLRYRTVRFLEDMAMRHAKRCLIICEALRPMLLERGVPADKIAVAPNCVDVAAFSPGPPSPALQDALGLGGKRVLGFIGSFFRYEGLELLVRAFTELAAQRQDLVLLLVGDGETEGELRELVAQSPVRDLVIFAGRAPYAQVMEYYKLFELMILPRLETPETRLVTPLKPLEIMSMEKPLLASDIGGHRELIEDGATGLLFPPGEVSHLVAACSTLLDDPRLARKLASQGRAWAAANRDWDVLMQRYLAVYADLGVRT